jgi:hypothetical protein
MEPRNRATPGCRRAPHTRKAPAGTPLWQGVPAPGGGADPWQARKHGGRDSGGPGSDLVYRNKVRTVNPMDTTVMHGPRESDRAIVPEKRPHKDTMSYAERSSPCRYGGGRGGKGTGQGQRGPAKQGPDTVPGSPVTGAGAGTAGSKGERETVDSAVASGLLQRPTAGGVVPPQSRCSLGRGWPDMGPLR